MSWAYLPVAVLLALPIIAFQYVRDKLRKLFGRKAK
jgi:hypothetical protein